MVDAITDAADVVVLVEELAFTRVAQVNYCAAFSVLGALRRTKQISLILVHAVKARHVSPVNSQSSHSRRPFDGKRIPEASS